MQTWYIETRDSYGVRDMDTIHPAKDMNPNETLSAIEANKYAQELDSTLLYLDDLDPNLCPPDMVYDLGDREAWVYEHDNIAELVFVRV